MQQKNMFSALHSVPEAQRWMFLNFSFALQQLYLLSSLLIKDNVGVLWREWPHMGHDSPRGVNTKLHFSGSNVISQRFFFKPLVMQNISISCTAHTYLAIFLRRSCDRVGCHVTCTCGKSFATAVSQNTPFSCLVPA